MPLYVLDHPLAQDKLARLRDHRTPPHVFASHLEDLAVLLFIAASESLPTRPVNFSTPLGPARGRMLRPDLVVLVPILRAGLGMIRGIARLLPEAAVHHLGLFRDETTLAPVHYYENLPATFRGKHVFILDPMLATGGSAVAAVDIVRERRPSAVSFLAIVSARAGVERLSSAHPRVPIYAAACDAKLNGQGYIVPGLGDAGDRLFGTAPGKPVSHGKKR